MWRVTVFLVLPFTVFLLVLPFAVFVVLPFAVFLLVLPFAAVLLPFAVALVSYSARQGLQDMLHVKWPTS